jgi:hypothetical protein
MFFIQTLLIYLIHSNNLLKNKQYSPIILIVRNKKELAREQALFFSYYLISLILAFLPRSLRK